MKRVMRDHVKTCLLFVFDEDICIVISLSTFYTVVMGIVLI